MRTRTTQRVSAPVWVALTLLLATGMALSSGQQQSQEDVASGPRWIEGWPVEIEGQDGTITVYQPQLEAWDGHKLEAHMAVSIRPKGDDVPTYGVAWVSARTTVDKQERLVELDDLEISRASFPSETQKEASYVEALRRDVVPNTRLIALDRLEAALALLEAENRLDGRWLQACSRGGRAARVCRARGMRFLSRRTGRALARFAPRPRDAGSDGGHRPR